MSARDDIMKDYVPVNERIGAFLAKHPDGCLQADLVELSETRVVMRAYAYRTPTDERPGIGYSSLEIPGRTPYTKGSEVENCETSAWGRAIAALGFEVKRGIASAEEVRNKQDDGRPAPARLPARQDPNTVDPEPDGKVQYTETEELVGRASRRGMIRKGTSEQYKLEVRQGPDGPVVGFKLEVGPEKNIPQCVLSGKMAASLVAAYPDPKVLAGTAATVAGILYYVRSSRGSSWYRLHVDRFENDEWIFPPDPSKEPTEALPEPLFSEEEQARIDAAVEKVPG